MSFNMGSQVRHMQKDKYLQVSMDHAHLVTVKHRLQNLLDAVAADRSQRSTPAPPSVRRKSKEEEEHGQVHAQQVCLLPGICFTIIFSGYNIFKQFSTCHPVVYKQVRSGAGESATVTSWLCHMSPPIHYIVHYIACCAFPILRG